MILPRKSATTSSGELDIQRDYRTCEERDGSRSLLVRTVEAKEGFHLLQEVSCAGDGFFRVADEAPYGGARVL